MCSTRNERCPTFHSVTPGERPLTAATWKRRLEPVGHYAKDAPRELCDLIHRCLAFNPGDRFERVKDLIPTLESLVKSRVVTADDRLDAIEW